MTGNTDKQPKPDLIRTLADVISREKSFYYYIASLMIAMPVCEMLTEFIHRPFITQPLILSLYGEFGVFMALLALIRKSKASGFYMSDLFFILLFAFAAISLVNSQDITRSLTGFDYDELPAHFAAYFCLMFAGTMIQEKKLRKNLLQIFLGVALLQCVIAALQTVGIQIDECYFGGYWHSMARLCYGLTQNCNFFVGLSILFMGASAGSFLFFSAGRKESCISGALYALCLYCSLYTGTRISWAGIISLLFFFTISFVVMRFHGYKPETLKFLVKRATVLLAVSAVVIAGIAIFDKDIFIHSALETLEEIQSGDFSHFGSERGTIWKYGLESVPKHWLTGVGLDNYAYAFFSNPNFIPGSWYQDKGHNEYIHTLVTQGVFAAANYLAMLIYACAIGTKTVLREKEDEKRFLTWTFLAMLVGYAGQACLNSSVINTAMYFWIVVGLTMPRSDQSPLKGHSWPRRG